MTNVLLVCVDCLRSDFVGSAHAETPFIDGLAERGTEYTNMFATATTTTPCVASLLTGTYSERNGVASLRAARLNTEVTTLAERFSAAGYQTHAEVTGPIVAETNLDRGFDAYEYRDRRAELTGDWFEQAVDTVESLPEPFFVYLHLWEIHTPIDVGREYDDPEYGRYPYARKLSELDRRLETLCGHLPEDTVVALHGDHGEAITYRDNSLHRGVKLLRTGLRYGLGLDTRAIERRIKRWFNDRDDHLIPDHFMEDGHGENVFDFTSNVPFVLAGPVVESTTVSAQTRQIDVAPTLLDSVGVAYDVTEMDGESLLPPASVTDRDAYIRACGRSLIRERNWQRAIRSGGWKYVEYPERNWLPELYDLDADPLELRPVENGRVETRLRARLPEKGLENGDKLEIDGLLSDLGYK